MKFACSAAHTFSFLLPTGSVEIEVDGGDQLDTPFILMAILPYAATGGNFPVLEFRYISVKIMVRNLADW